jgi:four helix bundle protein
VNREPVSPGHTFEDLEVYRVAREFRKRMYDVAQQLPGIEKLGLAGQMRRAAVSLTNNIAEGHGRFHFLDQIKFTLQARGSLEELIDDLNVCEDEQYWPNDELVELKQTGWRLRQLIDGYIRYLRSKKKSEATLVVREDLSQHTEDEAIETIHGSRFSDSQ